MENNSKNILIFSTAYYPYVGGAEVAIKEITDRIHDAEFTLITARMSKDIPFREKVGNVTVYRLGIGIPFIDKLILPFEGALFARHLLKKKSYDAFWGMMVTFGSGGAYLYNLFSKVKIPTILTLQEGDSERYLNTKWFGLVDLSWRLALRRSNVVTVISNYLGDRARRLGFDGEIKFIPNGVDVEKFTKEISNEEKMEIRKDWGFEEEDIILITSSRLNVKNGVKDVINALTKLSDNVKFVVCGVGELEDNLKNLTRNLKLETRVLFKGFVSHDDLPKYLKASDIFIRPSLSEGMGNSFIEAMVSGLPTIGTPVGGIVDFIFDAGSKVQTGYLCKPQDPQSIADTIKRVMDDPKKSEVIENAINLCIEKYNWDKVAVQMKEVFDSMAI